MADAPPPHSRTPAGAGRARRRVGIVALALLLAGLVAFALTRLNLSHVGHALVNADPAWIVLAVALMALSLVLRSVSWYETLRAALPETLINWFAVVRATMIGVMTSAVFPGRLGEPMRVVVLSRRLDEPQRIVLPVVAGTVFSQTLMNLLALAVLAVVTLSSVPLLGGHVTGVIVALALPLAVVLLVIAGPRLLSLGRLSPSKRLRAAALVFERLLRDARRGLVVFARPRNGVLAVTSQLLAWALQWLACYSVLLALHLEHEAGIAAAAAILLAVNVSAVLPATPSNVGVFQAACLVVLAAYGVPAGTGLAYGIILQAVEVVTALGLGVPALLREGLTWGDLRRGAAEAGEEEMRPLEQESDRDGAQASAREGAE
ncbi:MAG TPA: lysylphosphatidylglycerol synthase transmembrane domain-containing protein [Solirubrobacteraceae bacterium]|jgi:phosphatidylinositol alpha-mannosyltransferase|nr:lysylphosphatidylglycerol synthase transmembrane domain-containing protein [Solirubrobacteraceae bacterium]